jgi:hypothetical protein
MLKYLVPQFPLRQLPAILGIAVLGAGVSGLYGALHDQISYTISPEYFTKLKFNQFAWADAGWQPRVFAALIGFLATWWVGLIAGWLLARLGLAGLPATVRRRCTIRAFAIMLTITPICGSLGALLGFVEGQTSDLSGWKSFQTLLGVEDLPSFVIVAQLHNAGYLGALLGLLLAVWYVRRTTRQPRNT